MILARNKFAKNIIVGINFAFVVFIHYFMFLKNICMFK
jgi:hypothetical protein